MSHELWGWRSSLASTLRRLGQRIHAAACRAAGGCSLENGQLLRVDRARPRFLRYASTGALTRELLSRLGSDHPYSWQKDVFVASELQDRLSQTLEIQENRFSAVHHEHSVRPIFEALPIEKLKGARVIDLGCGSLSPFSFGFLLLGLGAERVCALDLDPIQDMSRALRMLPICLSWLISEGKRFSDQSPDPDEVLKNLDGF